MDLASNIGLPLAPLDDPNKAFILKLCSIILEIELDAKISSLHIPSDKVHPYRHAFTEVLNQKN